MRNQLGYLPQEFGVYPKISAYHLLEHIAVQKVHESLTHQTTADELKKSRSTNTIFIKDDKKYYQINRGNILYIEAYGNYVKIHLAHHIFVSHHTLSSFKEMLPNGQFIRVHKSYVVAIDKIELIEGNRISIGEHKIPIGKMYKSNINDLLP